MRDKQNPGDTYNYKEHVYADPLALRKEIEEDKQRKEDTPKIKKYQKPDSPPAVPSGPRQGTGKNTLYAELEKKSNVPRSSVRDLGSLFGGTIPRTSSDKTPGDSPPPPVPEVTESRNVLEETNSAPASPIEISQTDPVLNILGDDQENINKEEHCGPVEGVAQVTAEEEPVNVDANPAEPGMAEHPNAHLFGLEEASFGGSSPEPKTEVVIDVRINSEAGIEIGAEMPTAAADDVDKGPDDGGVRLIKKVKRTSTRETSSADKASTAPVGDSPHPSKPEHGSEAGSGSSGSTKRKKKDVESGLPSSSNMRRNLILISLFLFIMLILVSIAAVILVNYTQIFQ